MKDEANYPISTMTYSVLKPGYKMEDEGGGGDHQPSSVVTAEQGGAS